MKLEVGDYIRTKKGKIAKIISKEDVSSSLHRKEIVFILDIGDRLAIHSKKVTKSSKNIIDLIEVGDYVNGYKVTAIYNPNGDDIFNFTLIMEHGYKTINPYIKHYPIKSIVTKEQFDSMKYEVDSNE